VAVVEAGGGDIWRTSNIMGEREIRPKYLQRQNYRMTTNHNNPIVFINITGNVNAGEVNTAVEVLRNTSLSNKSGTR
jgi:hypothetical protein